ncbi:U3 small nucleolar RNA-associated protein 21 [[Candida] jaroonii]|uniref:U3 small nucleolar RNA-associated protein 21 n=1 Tax=[Candida] jaroonii TaxID=467808 RepID=A0ACA9YER4_9ASCO|nr:U3 small nucleolar RNA-associated protein 21 [[Candida] jaroonii]
MVEPVEKRRKLVDSKVPKSSKVFSPFRVLGNVSNEIPFAIGSLGSTFYAVTSVGRSFQIYDVSTLHLLFVSQTQAPSKLTALAAHFHYVFAGYNNKIGVYKRGRLEHTLETPGQSTIKQILVFGDFLITTTTDGDIHTFKKKNGSKYPIELHSSLYTINSKIHGDIVGLIHPPTYLNKVVVATTQNIFILNINTGKLLYQSPENQFGEDITSIEYAPALDIIAIGTAKGGVFLYNIKKGRILGSRIMAANEDSGSKVVSLSFRTDGSQHLVAGLSNGDLFFYELEKQTRIHVVKSAHKESSGGIANVKFLNGQSILVTNGGDNSLKEFVFDPSLSTTNSAVISPPRLLRSRGGHSAPPIKIEFPQEDKSHFILSASSDRSFWSFSLRKDAQSQEMSQRLPKTGKRVGGQVQSMREKLPEIIAISSNQAREGDWENIITGHKDETFARTWDSQTKRIGKHQLNTVDGGLVKSVSMSHCGNFAMVGSSNGGIGSYNLQSGLLRKKYMLHKKEVTGIAIDGMNQKMVSCGLDGIVGFYNFAKSTYLGKLDLESPITSMIYHKGSDLIACALDDLSVVVIDVVTQKIVRILYGHSNRITGLDFSPNGRWIVSVSLDGTLRTWDLPTGGCIDGINLPSVATSVKFSPIGDFLATTHVTGNGIFLWTNKSQFKHISTRHIEEDEFSNILMPNISGEGGSNLIEGALDEEEGEGEEFIKDGELKQIDSDLVTLSLGSKSKYRTLLHIDVIKQRSKPSEAVEKPKQAPFFLSLTGHDVGDRAIEAETGIADKMAVEEESDSKLLQYKSNGDNFESEFTRLLRQGGDDDDYTKFLNYLVDLPPSTTDLEIRSLNSFPPLNEMTNFVNALTQGLKTNKHYEIYQALFSMFLKNHGDVIYNNDGEIELLGSLEQFHETNQTKKDALDDITRYCNGIVDLITTV